MEERLKKFSYLIEYGSYTNAAQKLHTSQPALTITVQKLEKELGCLLLDRSKKQLTLTAAGEIAYRQGKALIRASDELRHSLLRIKRSRIPLRLGCVDSIAELLVRSKLLDLLEATYAITMTIQSSGLLLQGLRQHELDIAIFVTSKNIPQYDATDMLYRHLGNESLSFVQSSRLPAAGKRIDNFLAYNEASTTYAHIAEQLRHNNISVLPTLFSTNPSILLELALQEKGATVLPTSLTRPFTKSGKLAVIPTTNLSRPIAALVRPVFESSSVSLFMDAVFGHLAGQKSV